MITIIQFFFNFKNKIVVSSQAVVAYPFNPRTREADCEVCEFEATLVYIAISRTARVPQRNPISNEIPQMKSSWRHNFLLSPILLQPLFASLQITNELIRLNSFALILSHSPNPSFCSALITWPGGSPRQLNNDRDRDAGSVKEKGKRGTAVRTYTGRNTNPGSS